MSEGLIIVRTDPDLKVIDMIKVSVGWDTFGRLADIPVIVLRRRLLVIRQQGTIRQRS